MGESLSAIADGGNIAAGPLEPRGLLLGPAEEALLLGLNVVGHALRVGGGVRGAARHRHRSPTGSWLDPQWAWPQACRPRYKTSRNYIRDLHVFVRNKRKKFGLFSQNKRQTQGAGGSLVCSAAVQRGGTRLLPEHTDKRRRTGSRLVQASRTGSLLNRRDVQRDRRRAALSFA